MQPQNMLFPLALYDKVSIIVNLGCIDASCAVTHAGYLLRWLLPITVSAGGASWDVPASLNVVIIASTQPELRASLQ